MAKKFTSIDNLTKTLKVRADAEALVADKERLKTATEEVFKEVDKDGSGFIDKKELAAVLKYISTSLDMEAPSDAELTEEFKNLDMDGDKQISATELQVTLTMFLKTKALDLPESAKGGDAAAGGGSDDEKADKKKDKKGKDKDKDKKKKK